MASIETEVTRKLDNNYVQLDVSGKRMPNRYFKVPQDKVDTFSYEFKKNTNKNNIDSTLILGGGIFGACTISALLAGKMGKAAKMTIGIVSGILGGILSIWGTTELITKREQKLLKKYDVKELFYDNKKLPV